MNLLTLLQDGKFEEAQALLASGQANVDQLKYTEWVSTDYGDEGYNEARVVNYLPSAISAGRLDIAAFLLDHGANVGRFHQEIVSSLANANTSYAFDALKLVLSFAAKNVVAQPTDNQQNNLLHLLSMSKPLVNDPYKERNKMHFFKVQPQVSALKFAFTKEQIADLLTSVPVSTFTANVKNAQGDTPMHVALKNNHQGMVEWLKSHVELDLDTKNNAGQSIRELVSQANADIQQLFSTSAQMQNA